MNVAEDRTDEEPQSRADTAMRDDLDRAHAFLKRQIAERPLAVVGAAVGVGLLLGALLAKPRR